MLRANPLGLYLLLVVLAIAVLWSGLRLAQIRRRAGRVVEATRRLQGGDHSARSGVRYGSGVIQELARAFDEMADALAERQGELERTAETLRRQALVFETLLEGVLVTDPEGRIIDWNPGAQRLFGYTREEILGRSPSVFHPPELEGALEREIVDHLTREGRWSGKVPYVRKDGRTGVSEAVVVAQYDADGRRIAHIGVNRDVTDRIEAEAALRRSEEQYRLLFERNPHPMWLFDPETLRFLAVNDTAVQAYGWSREEFLQMTLKDIRPPEDIPLLMADLAQGSGARGPSGPWRHRTRDGSLILVEITAHDVELAGRNARICMAQNVTARVQAEEALRRSEEQLRQAQKMEAMGRLAGGVAHDFNNLLTAIRGNAEMALLDVPATGPVRAELEQLRQAADTAASLTRQLLSFSRREMLKPQVLDLNGVVETTAALVRRAVGPEFEVVTELDPGLRPVRADRAQMEQVVMNLALNARDAMPGGGRLVVRTRNLLLTEDDPQRLSYLPPGTYLLLTFQDSGAGMDDETRQRIFEPFFTTKEHGKGTGLGLFTVYGIVRQCGGHILVESAPGRGTEFRVLLPALEAVPAAETPRAASAELPEGGETILLVDDEPSVRLLAQRLLQRLAYTVLQAGDGEEALRVAAAHQGPIHLLLTDMTMPGMGGRELARRFTEDHPEALVVFMSGYTTDDIPMMDPEATTRFVQKPFTLQTLAKTVRDALDAASAR